MREQPGGGSKGFFLLLWILIFLPACAPLRPGTVSPPGAPSPNPPPPVAAPTAPAPGEIVILHTNDMHGGVRSMRPPNGGMASLASFIARWNDLAGESRVLLFDAGDCYQGTPEGNESKGRLVVEIMNRIGYDLGELGNHEFDHGAENARALVAAARFPWMGENLRDISTLERPGFLSGPRIFDVAAGEGERPVRIGVFGLLTEDLPNLTRWDTAAGLLILPEEETARRAVADLERRGADLVVALTHIGLESDSRLVAAVPGIDLVVGGHSHTFIEAVSLGEETAAVRLRRTLRPGEAALLSQMGGPWIPLPRRVPIVQAGANAQAAGEIRFRYDRARDRIVDFRYRLVPLDERTFPPDPDLAAFLAPAFADVDARMGVVVGEASAPFLRTRGIASSSLGNFLSDLMRREASAEIAFQNQGGIRAEIDSGPVTKRDLFTVSPFGNTVISMELTGQEIRAILERVVAGTSTALQGGITPLEVSGVIVWYDPGRNPGDRIVNVQAERGRAFDDRRAYRVATNSFVAEGGDNYPEFRSGRRRRDHGVDVLELTVQSFAEAARRGESLAPNDEARWKSLP